MSNVRSLALMLEQAHPELSNNERHAAAFLQEASSEFLAKINGWFDQTVDRVSDRFTHSTRYVTLACGFAVALFLQLDTVALLNRLWVDPAARSALVQMGQEAVSTNGQGVQTPETASGAKSNATNNSPINSSDLSRMQDLNLLYIPTTFKEWTGRWRPDTWALKLLGIVVSTLLLSLGAPFWYNALKNLIRLRSLIAQKDDDQRVSRQTNTASATGAAVAPPQPIITGERGNLSLVG